MPRSLFAADPETLRNLEGVERAGPLVRIYSIAPAAAAPAS